MPKPPVLEQQHAFLQHEVQAWNAVRTFLAKRSPALAFSKKLGLLIMTQMLADHGHFDSGFRPREWVEVTIALTLGTLDRELKDTFRIQPFLPKPCQALCPSQPPKHEKSQQAQIA